jgi:hypothetical protein
MTTFRTPKHSRQLVKVEGRDDIGEIVDGGYNVGSVTSIYCVGVHFPKDGLCAYYAKDRVTHLPDNDQ